MSFDIKKPVLIASVQANGNRVNYKKDYQRKGVNKLLRHIVLVAQYLQL